MADVLVPSNVHVPIIVTACAEEIERRGLTEEGIYRITGSLSSVNYLKEQFNRDLDTAVKHVADYDVNVLSSILKSFFRELPEPLIKWEEFIAFFNALEIEDDDERISMLNHTLVSLPKPRRDTFQYLLCHLVRVSEYESSNKMSLNNLAMIWAMTLFQPAPEVPEGEDATLLFQLENCIPLLVHASMSQPVFGPAIHIVIISGSIVLLEPLQFVKLLL
ncbi:unnamed protein product [Dibothriocephalus latus]|uniref:Rho-GAP domain-containing protein n=1 Tax=Dibothriocephalus latus TaxID=60516 RepID=A0A3P7NSR8_DIBLA|nr:unnamed protein product [Dibothriocephalus latus]